MQETGLGSRDLSARKNRIRRRVIGGLSVLALLPAGGLTFAIIFGGSATHPDGAELLFVLATIAVSLVGGQLLMAGFADRRERTLRALAWRNDRRASENERLLRTLIEMVAPISGKVDQMTKVIDKVPDYPEAVLDGVDLARGIPAERSLHD